MFYQSRVKVICVAEPTALLSTFSATNPAVKILLFHTFCLSLYGSSLHVEIGITWSVHVFFGSYLQ